MLESLTLSRRFGVLFAAVIATMGGVAAVAIWQLATMTLDAGRIVEEAREQSVIAGVMADLRTLGTLLEEEREPDLGLSEPAELLVEAIEETLDEMAQEDEDPSQAEHQHEEDALLVGIRAALELIRRPVPEGGGEGALVAWAAPLERAQHYAQVLFVEARDEAEEANADFQERAATLRWVLLGTVAFAAALLGAALALVHRGVVRPLHRLRDGAERLGAGDREHRIVSPGPDEIGDLARSFNAMADRLSAAQADLEERVRARTREFLRAARLADLGVLASGIAHEVNTPLASIGSCAEGLRRRLEAGELSEEILDEYTQIIVQETRRARDVTTRMLALVRQEPGVLARTRVGEVARQAVAALRHRAESSGVELEWTPPDVDEELHVDSGELVQILVNLLTNACDATPPGGRVSVESEVSGGELSLLVRDEGEGIAEEDLERIFEPFFTTKGPRQGTGLGLPLIVALAEHRGGRVTVASAPGEGSTFSVTLPTDWSESP